MTELDELERALEEAAAVWFPPALHRKMRRVIQLARIGETRTPYLGPGVNAPVEKDTLIGQEKVTLHHPV